VETATARKSGVNLNLQGWKLQKDPAKSSSKGKGWKARGEKDKLKGFDWAKGDEPSTSRGVTHSLLTSSQKKKVGETTPKRWLINSRKKKVIRGKRSYAWIRT